MKKHYRKGTVHPSSPAVSDHLSFLPAAILTLAASLSAEDREVLAYLLISNNNANSGQVTSIHHRKSSSSAAAAVAAAGGQRSCLPGKSDHPPTFSCDCFGCYMSYWVRWDCSPNRQLIHEIIDQFEDGLVKGKNTKGSNAKTKKERRKPMKGKADSGPSSSRESKGTSPEERPRKDELGGSFLESTGPGSPDGGTNAACSGEVAEEGAEKGPVRRLLSSIGERIWGVWN